MAVSLIFVSLNALAGMILIPAVGLLWSPFAAAITHYQAQRHGLVGFRYAVVGAIYSVFLLAPWFYLNSRVSGDERIVPGGWTFILLYTSWMFGPIVSLWILNESYHGSGTNVTTIVFWVMLAAWIASMIPLLASGGSLNPPGIPHVRRHDSGTLLPVRYVLPFASAWVSVAIMFVIMWTDELSL